MLIVKIVQAPVNFKLFYTLLQHFLFLVHDISTKIKAECSRAQIYFKNQIFMESIYSSYMSIDLPIFHIEMHSKSQRLYLMTIPHSQPQEYLLTFIMIIFLAYSILKMTF